MESASFSQDDAQVLGEGHVQSYEASATAFKALTDATTSNHGLDPKQTLHTPADVPQGHSWISRHFHTAGLASKLESLEGAYHLGNYVIDRSTGEKTFEAMSIYVRMGMHLLYYGTEQEKLLHNQRVLGLLKSQSEKMGREYDAPESKAHIQPFIDSFQLGPSMQEMVQPDPDQYPNFNAFFAREIKPEARPVAEPENDAVTSSPADCRLTAFPTIDLATKYWIKGFGFTLERLFGDAALAQELDGGSMVIARLAPQDYHRWHAPVSGTVETINEIPGAYYTVNPQAINEAGTMDVFCENRRSVMTVKRDGTGSKVVIIAVGAMLVGSIKYNPGMDQVGAHFHRGQCLGAFYYGGSTVIVVYPKGEVVLDEDLVRNSTEQNCETLMRVGGRVGVTAK